MIDARDRMLNGKRLGTLASVAADYDEAAERLALGFPDGRRLSAGVAGGPPVEARFFSSRLRGELVGAELAAALSEFAGEPLRLVRVDPAATAVDRERGGGVSLISEESVAHLSGIAGQPVDARRFRMLITVAGLEPHGEDALVGREVRVGQARVRFQGHVGRCLVTGQNPETGLPDLPTLELLSYRKGLPTSEPLAFGIYGEVLEPGTVRVGDRLEAEQAARGGEGSGAGAR